MWFVGGRDIQGTPQSYAAKLIFSALKFISKPQLPEASLRGDIHMWEHRLYYLGENKARVLKLFAYARDSWVEIAFEAPV